MVNFLRILNFLPKEKNITRNNHYTTIFKPGDELPLVVWTYFIKRRAGFRCEECGNTKQLDAHHIRPVDRDGKNSLENGKCLCRDCHSTYRRLSHKGDTHSMLVEAFGCTRGNQAFETYRNCKTKEEIEELINKLNKEDSKGITRWYFLRNPNKLHDWLMK